MYRDDRRRRDSPVRSVGAVAGCGRGGVPVVERRTGPAAYRAHEGIPDDLGTGRQRAGDGLRQPRGRLRHRGHLHPQSRHRGGPSSTATCCSTPRARTWWPGPMPPSRSRVLDDRMPEIAEELRRYCDVLERHYADVCDIEFTIERGKLWMLQNRIGKSSPAGRARVRRRHGRRRWSSRSRSRGGGAGCRPCWPTHRCHPPWRPWRPRVSARTGRFSGHRLWCDRDLRRRGRRMAETGRV